MSSVDKLEKAVSSYLSQRKGGVSDPMSDLAGRTQSDWPTRCRALQNRGFKMGCPPLMGKTKGGVSDFGGAQALMDNTEGGFFPLLGLAAMALPALFGRGMSGGSFAGGADCCSRCSQCTKCGGNILTGDWWKQRFKPGQYRAEQKASQLEKDLQKEREQRSIEEQMRRKIASERRYESGKDGGAINLQPRPKGGRVSGGELAVPVGPRPNVSFMGAGLSGGKMAQMAGMGVTGGAGASPWVAHVKKVAAQKGISYKDALKVASKSYRRGGMSCGGAFMGSMSDPMGDRNL